MLFRLILLLAIVGGLTIFALSNGTTLALSFLGMPTPPLPLALWVLGAIVAGVMTHLLVAALFRLSNLLVAAEVRSQFRRTERRRGSGDSSQPRGSGQRPSASDDAAWQNWDGYEQPVDRPPPSAKTGVKTQAPIDDWEEDFKEDWEDEPPQPPSAKPEPRSSDAAASPTSAKTAAYNYPLPRQPLGKPDRSPDRSVVDADFRVLVPPTRSAPEPIFRSDSASDNADDWFEDDDLETDEERRRRSGL